MRGSKFVHMFCRFDFLECIENEGVDEVAEKKRGEEKKRKRDDGGFRVNNRGLLGTWGWEEKERREKEDGRWKRKVIKDGVVSTEDMPLPREYRLGLEKRGEELHSSSRMRNSMGTGRTGCFRRQGRKRGRTVIGWQLSPKQVASPAKMRMGF